jgi:hypothetical protein
MDTNLHTVMVVVVVDYKAVSKIKIKRVKIDNDNNEEKATTTAEDLLSSSRFALDQSTFQTPEVKKDRELYNKLQEKMAEPHHQNRIRQIYDDVHQLCNKTSSKTRNKHSPTAWQENYRRATKITATNWTALQHRNPGILN